MSQPGGSQPGGPQPGVLGLRLLGVHLHVPVDLRLSVRVLGLELLSLRVAGDARIDGEDPSAGGSSTASRPPGGGTGGPPVG